MFRFLVTFGAGVYTGIYFAQNYEIKKVDDPKRLMEKAQEFVNEQIQKSKGEK